MKFSIIEKGLQVANRSLLVLKKHSPEILTGAGIAGGIVAAVIAAKATLELEENTQYGRNLVGGHKKLREDKSEEDYPTQVYQRDIIISYVRIAQGVVKTYALPVAIGAASIACILTAHGILRSRNAALTVAYNALSMAYNNYRERVREDLGEDKDYEYHTGLKVTSSSKKDPETGETVKTVKVKKDGDKMPGQYARFFDEYNVNYLHNQPDLNIAFLRMQQTYANERLRSRGHVFLNEVYDSLGLERSSAGAVVGWVLSKEGPNFIDFGIYDGDRPRARAFVNGDEPSVLLDFNVDGIIYDKI